jgi:hypothetical protein
MEPQNAGYVTPDPYLVASHATGVVRLHPDESTTVKVTSAPADQWNKVGPPQVLVTPPVDGLKADVNRDGSGLSIELQFEEPEDWEDDQYPVETMLRVMALIDGYKEPRVVERRLVVSKPKKRKPRPPAVLLDDPSFIRVTSRQPVALIPGGADAHVRLRWNGKDELAAGTPSLWSFSARCVTLPSFAPLTFSKPSGGRFELLVQVPSTIAPGQQLTFDVEASGPGGKVLKTSFTAQAAAIVTPQGRTLKKVVAEPSSQRKPPYRLVYVDKGQWDKGYWTDDGSWTPENAGCFHDPTESSPLTLIINEDYGLLTSYRESLTTKKLEPATVKERVTRYTSHVAFHLYQMYMNYKSDQEAQAKDESIKPATPEQMRGEIDRVAATLLKMMNISR